MLDYKAAKSDVVREINYTQKGLDDMKPQMESYRLLNIKYNDLVQKLEYLSVINNNMQNIIDLENPQAKEVEAGDPWAGVGA